MSILFKGRNSQAEAYQKSWLLNMYFVIQNVLRQGVHSLGEMWRTPAASLMTIAVLGLSLTLPATLYLVVKNVQLVSSGFENAAEISLFVKKDTTEQEAGSLVNRLRLYPEIAQVDYISKDDALAEFKVASGFGQALNYLDENPLPSVVLVTPTKRFTSAQAARELLLKLEQEREVDFGKLDIEWLERLNALLSLLRESVITIALLLLTSVILIIGNTIRLSIMDKKEEIQVMKLVGATNNFIQAPFLWTGIWYGLIGGLFSFIAIVVMMWWLASAVSHVAGVYQTEFILQGLSFNEFCLLVLLGIALGLSGSFLSVKRYIDAIEPDKI
ncbi:permease-like cell division protein FtsX [Pseudoalteromonas tunicata]|uniref:Cell division protein FtsX n=1 Tax=Pseudoalteromonas tunicata D2 TaxID=87626 RepID=A4C7B0_9GAMM|nr:permease-like cell division protein FtsX [Pseudoalteromonas tunicata]ATC95834.1 cell division transport system permease protein [Pseudoalteromonas tunicata]AXT31379.1 cell division protein FtsX [Pseudoalteromonas tunicata]EAR29864.1 cell division protein [Pseudoalteromonas tunicata D2]MDP4984114.1 permease-like cell division protein FtsX [Pseudoalteromonas tunicata]